MSKKGKIITGIVVFLVLIFVGVLIGNYNRLVNFNESIDAAWAQVENQLQRRNDLIPNLVETVKGYMTHEREVFENIANARAKLAGATTISEKIEANQQIESALSRLLAIAENYPDLKANQNFIRLQDELAGTENRIAVERRRYNEVVRQYNILTRRFPSNIVAAMFGFEKRDVYYEAVEGAEVPPEVNF